MTSAHVPASLQRRVRERAEDRCEYCHLAQVMQHATFHVDHVWPKAESGPTTLENLALACVACSLRKGHRTTAVDPETEEVVRLFNPRTDMWNEHFRVEADASLSGKTATGRATIRALRLNHVLAIAIRTEEIRMRRFP